MRKPQNLVYWSAIHILWNVLALVWAVATLMPSELKHKTILLNDDLI